MVKDSKKFFTENVQDYMNGFFEADQPEALILVSQEMLLSFPNDPIYHANLGTGYIMQGKTAEALAEYEAAYSLNKKDVIIVSNLAHTYAEMGQKEKAIDYYKKILKFGNAGEKRYAEEQIRELKEE